MCIRDSLSVERHEIAVVNEYPTADLTVRACVEGRYHLQHGSVLDRFDGRALAAGRIDVDGPVQPPVLSGRPEVGIVGGARRPVAAPLRRVCTRIGSPGSPDVNRGRLIPFSAAA